MCVGKITSIRTTVRVDGIAVNECGQCGCFVGKVPTGLFRRSQAAVNYRSLFSAMCFVSKFVSISTYRDDVIGIYSDLFFDTVDVYRYRAVV